MIVARSARKCTVRDTFSEPTFLFIAAHGARWWVMGLVQSGRRHIVGNRAYFLEASVVGLLIVFGCGKHEASTGSTEYFYEPDPTNHGSVAEVLPPTAAIADMTIIWGEYSLIDLHTNEGQPWHPTEPERSSILALFQNTQRVEVKERGELMGRLTVTDRDGHKIRIDVIIRDTKGGEVYYVDSDSLDPTNAPYAPIEKDGHPLFTLFQEKSAAAKK